MQLMCFFRSIDDFREWNIKVHNKPMTRRSRLRIAIVIDSINAITFCLRISLENLNLHSDVMNICNAKSVIENQLNESIMISTEHFKFQSAIRFRNDCR